MKLDLNQLRMALEKDPRVILAVLFGSARDGMVRPGSDVDLAVLFASMLSPVEFYDFYQSLAARLPDIAELDLVDLHRASTVLAFEALCGRRLLVRDAECVAGFASQAARQYEEDMMRAGVLPAAARRHCRARSACRRTRSRQSALRSAPEKSRSSGRQPAP